MTPEEARELSRLLGKVAALEATSTKEERPLSARGPRTLVPLKEPPFKKTSRPTSARPAFPTARLGESARAYAEKQRKHRSDYDNDQKRRPPIKKETIIPPPRRQKTRVVLWPEYADLEDGDAAVDIERHYRRSRRKDMSTWKMLAASERCARRLELRIFALKKFGPSDLFQETTVRCRRSDIKQTAILENIDYGDGTSNVNARGPFRTQSRKEGTVLAGFSVQAASRARGTLFIDTLSTNSSPGPLVACFMDWLQLVGCPATITPELEAFERHFLSQTKHTDDLKVQSLLRHLLGAAAQDLAFHSLLSIFRPPSPEQRHVTRGDENNEDLLAKMAAVVDEECLDLQEIFLDTTPILRSDLRISLSDLRRGLTRLLSCLPAAPLLDNNDVL